MLSEKSFEKLNLQNILSAYKIVKWQNGKVHYKEKVRMMS